MVQLRRTSPDEFGPISSQNSARYDGYKIEEVDDKILSRDGLGSVRSPKFYQMEVRLIL